MDTKVWLFLTKDELTRKNLFKSTKKWRLVYGFIGILLLIAILTYLNANIDLRPEGYMYATFALPYLFFMRSFILLKQEWKNGTIGWWLALPYSRSTLLAAKFTTGIIRILVVLLIAWTGIQAIYLYTMLFQDLTLQDWFHFVQLSAECFLLLLIYAPFMSAFGVLTGVITFSRLKPVVPLLWIVYGISGNALFFLVHLTSENDKPWGDVIQKFNSSGTSGIIVAGFAVGSILLAWILLALSTSVMNRKLDL
ncbi:ABC transporter permease subunit [Paenibacillus larvae]|nr:ABC transporter permease subunit [Paenibacillus larvae]AQR79509.1 hypothetical protein BXP28_22110 [Paenibacillus larvae subsp. larvae]AVF23296.1 ABC-type transport system involved in multi-copper enzyme maturation, permease component [Paenibacillus larvae subsp. larvae]AVG11827.1 ABC-type transport system involved in multi-copper enzyme maturation, permease component [Paenibacillus larvae subsp. larvae DSM 25430]ETK26022.1 hypothetical protein ERIC1_2c02160 [Paenibacillus larvae subsp. larv